VGAFPLLTTFSSLHNALHSTAFVVARNLAIFLAVLFWLALAFWVYKDARRRIDQPWIVGLASVLGLVPPFVGPIVYLLFRPAETLEDIHSRRAELRALERHVGSVQSTCPVCFTGIEPDYLVCPVCTTALRQPCARCDAPLEPLWQMCPYCAATVEPAAIDLDAALTREAGTFSREPRGAEA
jgi:Double zinc ribbon